MPSLSWVTVVWSMIASASLTLAAIYCPVWYRNRRARAHLLFSVSAVSLAAIAFCELWMMRARTPGELLTALKWIHVAMFVLLVSITWFVAIYLSAGRLWLAWTACSARLVVLLGNLLTDRGLNFTELSGLRQIRFLGEPVTVLSGVPNPAMLAGQFGTLLILVFIADAAAAAWRRGDRRKAVTVGGSAGFFIFTGLLSSMAVLWGYIEAPIVFSLLYLALIGVMGYELSTEVLRASQLVQELRSSEAGLREHQVKLQASNDQISDVLRRLIVAQETERTRIARDLHDDVSQRIAGLSIMISAVRRSLSAQPAAPDLGEALTSMQQSTLALAEEVRTFSHELHPALLQHAGLDAALAGFCVEFEKLHAIPVTYSGDANTSELGFDTALGLFRIAQEGLRNVARHARASQVDVRLTQTPSGLHLSIVDDGKGFDLAGAHGPRSGLGLISIDERARLLHGRVQIDTQPRCGTRLHVDIPSPSAVTGKALQAM